MLSLMNFQINFTISKDKEKELFSFLNEQCNCNILKGYSENTDFQINICEEPCLLLYLIVPQNYVDAIRAEPIDNSDLDANFCIYPFDENGNNLPFIRYERDEGLYRIYAGTSTMYGQGKVTVNAVLKKIKQWIKTNSVSHYRDGTPFCGITIYDIK